MDIQPPGAARDVAAKRHGPDVTARARLLQQGPGILHPVGARQDRGQRQAGDRPGPPIAGQRGGVDGLARAVGPAFGGQEHVDGRRGRTALDAPVGEVELGLGQRQKGEILPGIHRHHGGRGRTPSGGQVRGEIHVAFRVGLQRRQDAVGAGDQLHRHARQRRSIGQRAQDHMHAILARHCRNPQVRDQEPLRRGRLVARHRARNPCLKRVETGLQPRQNLAHRQAGGDIFIEAHGDVARAGPDGLGQFGGEAVDLPFIQGAAEILLLHAAKDVAVGDRVQ